MNSNATHPGAPPAYDVIDHDPPPRYDDIFTVQSTPTAPPLDIDVEVTSPRRFNYEYEIDVNSTSAVRNRNDGCDVRNVDAQRPGPGIVCTSACKRLLSRGNASGHKLSKSF